MSDLFLTASRNKFRFNTQRGLLSTEDLWDLPLTSRNNGLSLDSIAISVNSQLKELNTESFVKVTNNKQQQDLTDKLEILKFIIKTKQDELEAHKTKLEKSEKLAKLKEVLAKKEDESLINMTEEEIQKQIKELES